MRKDVRTGAVIGGLLIAVLILYGVVVSRSHNKKPGGEPVALGPTTPPGADAPGGTDGAANSAEPAAAAPAPAGDAPPASNPEAPAPPPIGLDTAAPKAPTGDQPVSIKSGASWAMLLSADKVANSMTLQTQTPDGPAADQTPAGNSGGASELPQPPSRHTTTGGGDSSFTAGGSSTSDSKTLSPNASSNYTVKSGDTLSSIARSAYGDARMYKKIMEANPKINPNRMRAGATIVLPGRSEVGHQPASTDADVVTKSTERHSSPKPQAPVDSSSEYRVVSNDNLYKISMKLYHTPNKVDLLYQFNKTVIGADPAKLKLNMVLKLPEPPTQTASTR